MFRLQEKEPSDDNLRVFEAFGEDDAAWMTQLRKNLGHVRKTRNTFHRYCRAVYKVCNVHILSTVPFVICKVKEHGNCLYKFVTRNDRYGRDHFIFINTIRLMDVCKFVLFKIYAAWML